jgi:hypothetical protein
MKLRMKTNMCILNFEQILIFSDCHTSVTETCVDDVIQSVRILIENKASAIFERISENIATMAITRVIPVL